MGEIKSKMKHISFGLKAKKHISSALIAAFGLIAALAWKDVLDEYLTGIVSLSPIQSKLITALIITVISLIAVVTITKVANHKT